MIRYLALLLLLGCGSHHSSDPPVISDDYFAHRGGPLDTFAMVAFTGAPNNWTDPATADWPTSTLSGPSLLKGANWDVWMNAILARNPALAADIVVTATHVQYKREALEHYLSMHKWVVMQHAVPPKTLERIRSRSRVGTRFGLFCNFEAVAFTRVWTTVLHAQQSCLLPFYLRGTHADANGFFHVDMLGGVADPNVPSVETGQLTDLPTPGRWWWVDIRQPAAATAMWNATSAIGALYGGTLDFFYWDNVLLNPYFGPAPNEPFVDALEYRAGWNRLLNLQAGSMTWGNSAYPTAPEYVSTLGVPYHEFFFGNPGISEPVPSWTEIAGRIDLAAAEGRPVVIGQACPPASPQGAWMMGTAQWPEIVARVAEKGATMYVQTTRDWSFWQPGFLPVE